MLSPEDRRAVRHAVSVLEDAWEERRFGQQEWAVAGVLRALMRRDVDVQQMVEGRVRWIMEQTVERVRKEA